MEMSTIWRDWAELPEDLLIRIHKLLDFADLHHSSGVCSSWRSASADALRLGMPQPGAPCLFYRARGESDPNIVTLYCVVERKPFKVRIPNPPFHERVFIGSSHGWLMSCNGLGNLQLLNPVIGAQIVLPPANTFERMETKVNSYGCTVYTCRCSSICPMTCTSGANRMAGKFYLKGVLSSDPSEGDHTAVVIHFPCRQLSFARSGDQKWTRMAHEGDHQAMYLDCVHHRGMLYALQVAGNVYAFDLSQASPVRTCVYHTTMSEDPKACLVGLPNGDLLKVTMIADGVNPGKNAWRVDFAEKRLSEVGNLGDCTLFVQVGGFCHQFPWRISLTIPARDCPRLPSNLIYYADYFGPNSPHRRSILLEARNVNSVRLGRKMLASEYVNAHIWVSANYGPMNEW